MNKYEVNNINHYPENGKHLYIKFEEELLLDYDIQKGLDPFWYENEKGEQVESKIHLWYCFCDVINGFDPINSKGYKTEEKVLEAFVKAYNKFLDNERQKLK
jgi:hypothetical protein